MSPANLDLFQLTEAEQAIIRRALKLYAAAIDREAAAIEAAGDGGPGSRAWTADELRQVQQLLATFEPEA